ncbi:Bud site selection protein 6 [Tulasnella sp. 332]|nr:Bud site selection protein 6 [Tulasnella sp. 332]
MSSADVARSHRTNGSSSSSTNSRAGSSARTSTARSHPQVESAVTRLLVAIKQLLESLTNWSIGKMTDAQVSDVYVQLGNDFNTCVTAFGAYDIDMRDLLTVPMALRTVLETALGEEATPANLDLFLPEVRQIITDLLQGLRGKQSIFRQKVADRAQRRQDRQASEGPRSSRSGSQPTRPLPTPSVPEDELRERTSPPPPPTLPPTTLPPMPSQPVASAIPERVTGGRRKYSHPARSSGYSDSGQSDGEGSGSRPRRASTNRRLASSSSVGGDDGEALADLAATANAAEERIAAERARRLPLPPSTTPTPAAVEKEDPLQPPLTESARSSITIIHPSEKTPPRKSQASPALSPEVKRYSLVDNPISPHATNPPLFSNISTSGPVLNIDSASPSPPSTGGSGFLNGSSDNLGLNPTNAPAVAKEIAELEQTDILQRKASKRFSTYTFSKMAGGAGIPTIPSLPNGTAGSSNKPGFNKSVNRKSIIAPSASVANLTPKDLETLAEADEPSSPQKSPLNTGMGMARSKSADEGRSTSPAQPEPTVGEGSGKGHSRGMSGRIRREVSPAFKAAPEGEGKRAVVTSTTNGKGETSYSDQPETEEPLGTPGYMAVYLQVGRSVKKVMIERGSSMSFASLRVLFVDKFSYSPGQDNFPAIYIRAPMGDIQYELEDINEIKDGCLLSLNIEPLDQVKQHIDMQMASLSNDIKDLKAAVNSQRRMSATPMPISIPPSTNATPQQARPTDQQFQGLARRLSRINRGVDEPPMSNGRYPAATFGVPKMQPLIEQSTGGTFQSLYQAQTPTGGSFQSLVPHSTGGSSFTFVSEGGVTSRIAHDLKSQFDEVQNLRRDLGIMRQVYTDFMGQAKTAIGTFRSQTETVQGLANSKIGGSRAYIDTGKAKLDTRSQNVLTKIEELQDLVEGLRDDVLKRHISPKANVMKSLKADIQASQKELDNLTEHISTVKPIWKKTWEEELQNIVEEQQFLAHEEELISDLIEDHKALMEVFGHVEKVITIRNNTMPSSGSGRGGRVMRTGRQFRPPPPEAGHDGLSTVMLEIRGAAIDPTRRLKAIEANQKAREKERMARSDEFTEELGEFVNQKKLKMTGGIEETERLRQLRSDHTLKNMFSPAAGGVAGGIMIGSDSGGGGFGGGFGDGGSMGMNGLTFAQAPSIPDDDPFGGGGGFGMGGFSFAKAPAAPDSP